MQAARLESLNSLAINPNPINFITVLANTEFSLGHPEASLSLWQKVLKQYATGAVSDPYSGGRFAVEHVALLMGDYAQAESVARIARNLGEVGNLRFRQAALNNIPVAMARRHDGAGRTAFRQLPPPPLPMDRGPRSAGGLEMEAGLENWRAVIAQEPSVEDTYVRFSSNWDTKAIFARQLRPLVALAKANLGDHASAQQLISQTPGDCYDCVRARGVVAALAGQPGRADYWFSRAVHDAPSIPFAYHDWGRALLDRGQPDAAIEQFKLSIQKGPHFADPLEGWGEALMAKNQSHLALAKFTEVEKYAPNWGRLHLKWGEALVYAGKRDEAKPRFARAAQLDLTPAEKAELARHP